MLIEFLGEVADNSQVNQMGFKQLATCIAPSLFHISVGSPSKNSLEDSLRESKKMDRLNGIFELILEHQDEIFN